MSEGRDPVHVQGDPCIGTGGSPYKKLKGGKNSYFRGGVGGVVY